MPLFGRRCIRKTVQALVEGDLSTARVLFRDFINATVRFPTSPAASESQQVTDADVWAAR
jgi:hypothetical protein